MIRKYKDVDADAIVSTWRAASEVAHPFLTREFLDREADAVRNIYLAFADTWVTEVDGETVGFVSLVDDEVGGMFLDPRYHGQGYGKAMMDHAIAHKGALRVEVFKRNKIGRAFYDRYGFRGSEEYIHEPTGEVVIRMAFVPQ